MTESPESAPASSGAGPPSAPAPSGADDHDHQTSNSSTDTTERGTASMDSNDDFMIINDERSIRAAWTILANACDGRLLQGPWVDNSGERLRYVPGFVDDPYTASLSISDQCVLGCVHSLLDEEREVSLGMNLGFIEREDLKVVLSALTWFLEGDVDALLVVDDD